MLIYQTILFVMPTTCLKFYLVMHIIRGLKISHCKDIDLFINKIILYDTYAFLTFSEWILFRKSKMIDFFLWNYLFKITGQHEMGTGKPVVKIFFSPRTVMYSELKTLYRKDVMEDQILFLVAFIKTRLKHDYLNKRTE